MWDGLWDGLSRRDSLARRRLQRAESSMSGPGPCVGISDHGGISNTRLATGRHLRARREKLEVGDFPAVIFNYGPIRMFQRRDV